MRRTIEELRELQSEKGLRHIHLVDFDDDGFTLAHTDAERAAAADGGAPLDQCAIHRWLAECGDGGERGVHVFRVRKPDAVSESYRGDAGPWELVPIERADHNALLSPVFGCRR